MFCETRIIYMDINYNSCLKALNSILQIYLIQHILYIPKKINNIICRKICFTIHIRYNINV